jgi:methionyl-tRNA formyltransferase
MRLIFLGTGRLGLPALRAIVESKEHEVTAVVTQPDRPAGRGLKARPSPVKELAEELGLSVFQPERVNREVQRIRAWKPDALVAAAYGQILSKELLEVPRLGSINLHASLLPKYRGAAPIQWAIIQGETITGVTTFLMDEGLDTGPILLQRSLPISDEDTAGTLEERLAKLGAGLMIETLRGLEAGTLVPRAQDDSQASYAPKITKELGRLDWTKSARELFNLIRALNPAPGAYTFYKGARLKVHRSHVVDLAEGEPGEVIGLSGGLIVRAGEGALELLEVQPEGKRAMSGEDFARGRRITLGERLEAQ